MCMTWELCLQLLFYLVELDVTWDFMYACHCI